MSDPDRLIALNPFPGLRPFAIGDADRFFGRGTQIDELEARLRETSFLAVVGASGCGKSSLVCAGLLGRMAARPDAYGTRWLPVVMRPGTRPITALAQLLSPSCGGTSASEELRVGSLYGRLRIGGLGLVEAIRLAKLSPETRILLVIDQFEELFRFRGMTDPDEANAFVKLILHAAADQGARLSVVITMRAERIGDCAKFRDLPETINRGQYLVPKLTTAQRRETISGPVQLRGFSVAPRLVQRVLNDVSDDFDDLPIMQHALTRTWNRWVRDCEGAGPLDLEAYEAIGTAKSALSQHAEEALASLGEFAPVAEKTFRAITEQGPDGVEGRRPLKLDRLRAVVGARPEEVDRVVERFREPGTAFLVPADDNGVVDITHEALIRQWKRLLRWARVEAESREMLLRVLDAAEQQRRGEGSLWSGRTLRRAEEWRLAAQPTSAWVGLYVSGDGAGAWKGAEAFLDESAAAQRREEHKKSVSRLLRVVAAVAFVVTAGVFGVLSTVVNLWKSRELASRALLELRRDPALAAHLALASMARGSHGAAETVLRQALATLEGAHLEGLAQFDEEIYDAQPSGDGSLVVVAAGKSVELREIPTLSRRAVYTFPRVVWRAWLVHHDTRLLTFDGGAARVTRLDATDPTTPREWTLGCRGSDGPIPVWAVAPSADGRLIALGCPDGAVRVFSADAPDRPVHDYPRPGATSVTATALAFSNDGRHLAVGDAIGVVRVWRLGATRSPWIGPRRGEEPAWPVRHGGAVRDISFHPELPELLLTGGDDGRVVAWYLDLARRHRKVGGNRQSLWEASYGRPVTIARFAPRDGSTDQVFLVVDKRMILWNAKEVGSRTVRGHDNWVRDASASPSGSLLVTASDDGTARIWYALGGTPVAVLRGHRGIVLRAFFGRDEDRVVTASEDRTVRIWHVSVPRILDATPGWTLGVAFGPDPRADPVVAIGNEKALRVVLTSAGAGDVPTLPLPEGFDQISRMSWSADGRLVGNATTSRLREGTMRRPVLWDAKAAREITPPWLREWLWAAFAPSGDELVTSSTHRGATADDQAPGGASRGGTAVWELSALGNGTARPSPVAAVGEGTSHWMSALSADHRWLATYGEDGLRLWDRRAPGQPGRSLLGHEGSITTLEFSPDSQVLLSASLDGTARLWPVEEGRVKVLQASQARGLACASFDESGHRIVTGGADGNVYVWDSGAAALIATLRWHGEGVNEARFSRQGEWILSASDDGTVKLGRCGVCNLASRELADRVAQLAILDATGKKRLEDAKLIRLRDEMLASQPTISGR